MTEIGNFLDALKTDSTVETDASFTLSEKKALEKLSEFSFASDGDHLLRLLQVAQLSGTREVHVKLGSRVDTVTWKFEGELPDLEQTREQLLVPSTPDDKILRHLLPVLRDGLKRQFEWRPGGPEALRWTGNELLIEETKGQSGVARFWCRHSTFLKAIFGGYERLGKSSALGDNTRFLGFRLCLDSLQLSSGWRKLKVTTEDWFGYFGRPYYLMEGYFAADETLPAFPCPPARFQADQFLEVERREDYLLYRSTQFKTNEHGFYGTDDESLFKCFFAQDQNPQVGCAMAFDCRFEGDSTIRFWLDGVLSDVWKLEVPLPGLQVVVSGTGLKTDLSGLRVVKNQVSDERLVAVRNCVRTFHKALLEQRSHYLLNYKRGGLIFSAHDAFVNQYHTDFARGLSRRLPEL